jgi:hypothetical protein
MSKYDSIPITPHKARVEHICLKCGKTIKKGEIVAYQKDSRIHQTISQKKYCEQCFKEVGQGLINLKKGKMFDSNQRPLG